MMWRPLALTTDRSKSLATRYALGLDTSGPITALIWFRTLRRRSQKARRLDRERFKAMVGHFPLPLPRITHPWTEARA